VIPLRTRLKHRIVIALGWKCYPFHNDAMFIRVVDSIMSTLAIKSFVETGTFLGFSSKHIARNHPDLKVLTIECNNDYHALSRISLSRYSSVTQYLGDSAALLPDILSSDTICYPTLFFLDAHWKEYLPLTDELLTILGSQKDAVIIIDDFQVPDRGEYGFDTYHGQPIGLGLLKGCLHRGQEIALFLPNYDATNAYGPNTKNGLVTGYAILVHGFRSQLPKLRQLSLIRDHFKGFRYSDGELLSDDRDSQIES
jgi:hypothetical protein